MRTTHRRVAALAAPVLVLSGLASGQSRLGCRRPDARRPRRAARWLVGQLTSGVVHNDQFAFDDFGLTTDFGLALAELGGQPTALASVAGAMATHVHDYTEPGFGTDISAGGTAKVLRLAQVTGGNPRAFGGVDLVARLETLTGGTGRIADDTTTPADPDFANMIGQSFAVQGLTVAGSPEAAAAASFLLAQQCPAGWFRLNLLRPASPDQSCNGASPAATPDTDVTALAVLALQSRRTDPAVGQSIAKAMAWLKSVQLADGSFGGGTSTDTPNTNSTGLAAAALGSECAVTAADKASSWVRGLQVPRDRPARSRPPSARSPTTRPPRRTGWPTASRSRRRTSGAARPPRPPRAGVGRLGSGHGRGDRPEEVRQGRQDGKVTITGAAAGERVCVTGPGRHDGAHRHRRGPGRHVIDTQEGRRGRLGHHRPRARLGDDRHARQGAAQAETGQDGRPGRQGGSAAEGPRCEGEGQALRRRQARRQGQSQQEGRLRRPVRGPAQGGHATSSRSVGEFKNRAGTATFRVVR